MADGILAEIRAAKKPFYVYLLLRPNGEPFYVGKGQGRRIVQHEQKCNLDYYDDHKTRVIRKILRGGKRVGKLIDSWHDTEDAAWRREEELIAKIGRLDLKTGPLTNKSSGGEGNVPSPEGREKISKHKSKWHADHPLFSFAIREKATKASGSDHWKAAQSAAQKKFIEDHPELHEERCKRSQENMTPEVREKIRQSQLKFFQEHPEAVERARQDRIRWARENREHYERMWANSKTPEAIEKSKKNRAKFFEEHPEVHEQARLKRHVTVRAEDYREAARLRVLAQMADNPEEFIRRREKHAETTRRRTELRILCERLVQENNLGIQLPKRQKGIKTWTKVYEEIQGKLAELA